MTPAPPRNVRSFLGQWPLAYIGIATVGLAFIVGILLWLVRGSHLEIQGVVQQVRTLSTDDTHSILIVDFRATNVADYPFVVRSVTLSVEDSSGKAIEGNTVAEIDARRLFEYYKQLGAKNDTLITKETLAPHQAKVRMIAAQFDIPESELQKRKALNIHIQELDGAVSDIRGK